MTVNEYNVLMRYKDAAGDTTVLYPITKQENITTSGSGAAYIANVASIMELKNGVSFVMIPHTDSTSTSPTLDVNGLGAKRIRRRLSSSTGSTSAGATDNWLTANKAVRIVYDGSFWIVDFTKPNATDLFGITPIENGGTNASTAEEARANILPPVTSDDEGKNLCVSEDGVWVVGKTSGLATLYVTAPAGVTVTATKDDGSETYSVVADSNGLAIFDLTVGTWTISITNELQTQTRTVVIEPDYTASIKFFAATITVSYPAGSTCTCSNSSYTFNAPDTSGSCTFTVFKTGTWTVRCTDGADSDSESVSITTDGQSTSVTLKYFASYISVTYPEGSTCTCSDGSTTLTASDTSGSYTFTVKNTGTWTIRIVDGNQEASTTVSITADGQNKSVTLEYFKAYITITYPEGSSCTCSDGITTLTASATTGSWLCKVPNAGTWTVSCTNGVDSDSATVTITTDGQSESITLGYNRIPEFTYTGSYQIVDDSDKTITTSKDNWKIRFLTSGTLKFTELNGAANGIDVFCVGGGGGGGYSSTGSTGQIPGTGGGGGYTTTKSNVTVAIGTAYAITIGSGGSAATDEGNASDGGTTSAFTVSANGGCGGSGRYGNRAGGDGGSGGGGSTSQTDAYYEGGTDGSDGEGNSPGEGQGTTTKEFGESNNTLYSTGGTAGYKHSGDANTGDGAGGGPLFKGGGGSGGSGIVVIRNKR